MGADNFTFIIGVNPSAEQLPDAPITETGVVPDNIVTTKSLPSAAMLLHFIFFLKTNCSSSGAQPNLEILSIGVGIKG